MRLHRLWDKYKDHMAVLLVVLCNAVLMSLMYDYYYDLNDDVMMKDVLAGVYTGTPDGHNMQMLYVLGSAISFCYRVFRSVPWYGLFLCLCQFVSIYLAGIRLLSLCRRRIWKCIWLVMLTLFLWGVPLLHMVAVQYTIVCSLMACAAIFWFMTTPRGLSSRSFVLYNCPAMVLVILAFWLRTEMLLLLSPFIAAAGLYRLLAEERPWQKENCLKYGLVLGVILAGMGMGLLVDKAAYGSTQWQDFRSFFDNRTRLYDFHYDVVTDDVHAADLEKLGVSKAQRQLLANYNFGLDESIDERTMEALADYADEYAVQNRDVAALLIKTAGWYGYRMTHLQDGAYSVLVLSGYVLVIIIGVYRSSVQRGRGRFLPVSQILLLMLIRSVPWIYILLNGRDPVRITHSLYLVEFFVLMGMLYLWLAGIDRVPHKKAPYVFAGIGVFALACMIPDSVGSAGQDMEQREAANQTERKIDVYCRDNPDSFYFEDVYSTVSFSEKMFDGRSHAGVNRDIMGGWMCKSPLYRQKLARYDIDSMAEGLLDGANVYIIIADDSPGSDTAWLVDYYREHGIAAEIRQTDRIDENCGVYQVCTAQRK